MKVKLSSFVGCRIVLATALVAAGLAAQAVEPVQAAVPVDAPLRVATSPGLGTLWWWLFSA